MRLTWRKGKFTMSAICGFDKAVWDIPTLTLTFTLTFTLRLNWVSASKPGFHCATSCPFPSFSCDIPTSRCLCAASLPYPPLHQSPTNQPYPSPLPLFTLPTPQCAS